MKYVKTFENFKADDILDFAEQVGKENDEQINKYDAWVAYITPLFKDKFDLEFRTEYVSMYDKEKSDWIESKRADFNKKYKK